MHPNIYGHVLTLTTDLHANGGGGGGGLPCVLLSDNGSEFCNALNDQLSEMLGIKRRLTTPYHPQVCSMNEYTYKNVHTQTDVI